MQLDENMLPIIVVVITLGLVVTPGSAQGLTPSKACIESQRSPLEGVSGPVAAQSYR